MIKPFQIDISYLWKVRLSWGVNLQEANQEVPGRVRMSVHERSVAASAACVHAPFLQFHSRLHLCCIWQPRECEHTLCASRKQECVHLCVNYSTWVRLAAIRQCSECARPTPVHMLARMTATRSYTGLTGEVRHARCAASRLWEANQGLRRRRGIEFEEGGGAKPWSWSDKRGAGLMKACPTAISVQTHDLEERGDGYK